MVVKTKKVYHNINHMNLNNRNICLAKKQL